MVARLIVLVGYGWPVGWPVGAGWLAGWSQLVGRLVRVGWPVGPVRGSGWSLFAGRSISCVWPRSIPDELQVCAAWLVLVGLYIRTYVGYLAGCFRLVARLAPVWWSVGPGCVAYWYRLFVRLVPVGCPVGTGLLIGRSMLVGG